MTQGTNIPPGVDEESIEYGHVYANYVKSVADTPADTDANPDIVHVNGQVTFDSTFPGASARGSIRLPGTPRSYGLIVTGDTFEIVNSKLVDHEGREGVRLIAAVDGLPVSWQASVTLQDSAGRTIYNQSYIIHYDLWSTEGGGLEINLPDLIPTPSRLEPPEGAAIRAAEKALEEIRALTGSNEQINLDIEGLKSEVIVLHGETGDRLTAAEAARAAAVTAQGLAEAAQSASETARNQAQTARDEARTARTGAETARDEAQGRASDAASSAGAASRSASDAAGSASAAAGSASDAAGSASEASQSATDADTHRQAAEGHASDAATASSGAEDARDLAQQAQQGAEDERVVAQDAVVLAEGHAQAADGHRVNAEAAAALAQSLRWVVKGAWSPGSYEAGDVVVYDERAYYAQTATSAQPPAQPWVPLTPAGGGGGASHWDDLHGKPVTFPPASHTHDAAEVTGEATPLLDVTEASVGAQSVGEALDATTDVSRLEGALTDQVDASAAVIQYRPGGQSEVIASGLSEAVNDAAYMGQIAYNYLVLEVVPGLESLVPVIDGKADAEHTHTWSDISDAPTYSKDTTGDTLVQRGSNGHINVPADPGANNAPRRSYVDAALAEKADTSHTHTPSSIGAEPAQWYGTQGEYDALGTYDPNRVYNIVE